MESCLLYNYTAVPLAHTVWSWTSFLRVLWCFVSCYLARLLPERNKLTVHKRYIILSVLSFHWRPLDSKTRTMRTICGVRVRASVILAGKRDSRRHGPFSKYLTTLLCPSKNFQSAMFSVSLEGLQAPQEKLKTVLTRLELVLGRVRNSRSLCQSNVCTQYFIFAWDLVAVRIIGVSVIAGCPQAESQLY